MKTLAFIFGLGIAAVGATGIFAPSALVWIGAHFTTSGPFYVLAAVRIAFGLILLRVAPESRLPKALRVLGGIIVLLGLGAAVAGLVALPQARASIEAWQHAGPTVERLTSIAVLALGSFVAYACAPRRRLS